MTVYCVECCTCEHSLYSSHGSFQGCMNKKCEYIKKKSPWHTGTPTEEGWYLIAIRFGNRIEYESRKCKRIIDNNGNECMRFDGCNPVLAWQKITPYESAVVLERTT